MHFTTFHSSLTKDTHMLGNECVSVHMHVYDDEHNHLLG